MATQTHEGRNVLIEKINQKLAEFVNTVDIAKKNNLPSRNVLAETTLKGLLNRIYKWKLINANAKRQNFPGVDLIDTDNRIAVQVTSTNKPDKVDHTLEQFSGKELDKQFSKLYIVVITDDNPTPAMKQRALFPCFSGEHDIWNIPILFSQIKELNIDTLEEMSDYLIKEVGHFTYCVSNQHLYLPPVSTVGDGFVGREKELKLIGEKLCSHVKPVFLSGLGGIGKSELASRFGFEYEDGNVYFIRFNTSFTATVSAMFKGVYPKQEDEQAVPPDEQYKAVMSLLEQCSEKDILIIDNVNADNRTLWDLTKDKAYKKLKEMKLQLIMTTRFEVDRAVVIRPMPNDKLYEIFKKHGASLEQRQMDELIEAVNGHTLTIDLIARTLNGKSWRKVTPEKLLDDLRNNSLPSAKYRAITTDYNQSEDQAQIYQHLSTVFNLTKIPDVDRFIMCCATLLPTDGINGELFASPFKEETQDTLDTLINHGWLIGKDGLLSIHPVIRLVCQVELKKQKDLFAACCSVHLDSVWAHHNNTQFDRIKYEQLAELFSNAANLLDINNEYYSFYAGYFWYEIRHLSNALHYTEQAISHWETMPPSDSAIMVAGYNSLGAIYTALGNYAKASEYIEKAITILNSTDSPNYEFLSVTYNNMGSIYAGQCNPDKSLEYRLMALDAYRKTASMNKRALANLYSNLGFAYAEKRDFESALKFKFLALDIQIDELSENHPDIALSYHNIAFTYAQMGDYAKAFENARHAFNAASVTMTEEDPRVIPIKGLLLAYAHMNALKKTGIDPSPLLQFLK